MLEREDDATAPFLTLSKVRFHSWGGRDDEQARQSGALAVMLESRGISLISGNCDCDCDCDCERMMDDVMQMGVGPGPESSKVKPYTIR